MKTGIIIICHNNEIGIDLDFCVMHFNNVKEIEICLVNNRSKDNTYDLLKEISYACNNVSVINMKNHKPEALAVRAGTRYMFNQFNLKQLGYVINDDNIGFNSLVKIISKNQDTILNYKKNTIENKEVRQSIFKKLFSITDLLIGIETKNKIGNLTYKVKI